MKCVVLAAKHERAVDSPREDVPRPLLDLDKETLLTRLIKRLSAIAHMGRITIVVNEAIRPAFDEWIATVPSGLADIDVLSDGTRLPEESKGAMGDLIFAIEKKQIDEDLLIIGGDNWFTYDLRDFVQRAQEHHPAVAATPLQPGWRTHRFGLVETDDTGCITQFIEKPERSTLRLKASCVYFLSREDLKWLSTFAQEHSTNCAPGSFVAWLTMQTRVYAVEMKGSWYDISSPRPLTGPAWLELRQIVRRMVGGSYSTWERDAAKSLQWINSWEDVIEMMDHEDPNIRILSAELAGRISGMIDQNANAPLVSKLLTLLKDNSENLYQYAVRQSDEDDSSILVSEVAADSLVKLGYAKTRKDVFARARREGHEVRCRCLPSS
jgi:glucose-1-phosphate thymidylyltransferase